MQAPVKYYRPGEEPAVKRCEEKRGGTAGLKRKLRQRDASRNRIEPIRRNQGVRCCCHSDFRHMHLQTAKQINATNEKQSVKNNDFPSPDSSMPLLLLLLLPHRWAV